ncbi:hypothetical protein 2 [Beihai sobemo-like virus 17]|uniref:hypothetical protein 2 n=1 Tax=Beihai sobemo-like virus 17 TaxID=1922688 RepID=UPI00090B1AAE|nr:hypothetical protein 2 [Beihai sobemo-like virus 17]APG75737.1 hypothetical protein 2 [Beihai sobemo-like virus 17]
MRDGTPMLDPKSCPGNPWVSLGSTNEVVFGYLPGFGYQGDRVNDLYHAVLNRFKQLETAPAMDPIFPFIKQEPHKKTKLEEGRVRIISGVSATDQIVADLLFMPELQSQMQNTLYNGIAIGWAPNVPSGIVAFNEVTEGFDTCADKSSWDWTVVLWMVNFACQFFVSRATGCHEVLKNHILAMLGPKKFKFRGGVFRTEHPGVMPSGWKVTILLNSLWQKACHIMCGSPGKILSMGDDTIQEPVQDSYWDKMAKLGPKIKEIRKDGVKEFCGVTIDKNGYYPVYTAKHSYVLHHLKPAVAIDTLRSYQTLYAYCPKQLSAIRRWLRELGRADAILPDDDLRKPPLGLG